VWRGVKGEGGRGWTDDDVLVEGRTTASVKRRGDEEERGTACGAWFDGELEDGLEEFGGEVGDRYHRA
jgi:hypothetical protein